jgi:hypothetical protein
MRLGSTARLRSTSTWSRTTAGTAGIEMGQVGRVGGNDRLNPSDIGRTRSRAGSLATDGTGAPRRPSRNVPGWEDATWAGPQVPMAGFPIRSPVGGPSVEDADIGRAGTSAVPTVQAHVQERATRHKRGRHMRARAVDAVWGWLLNWHVGIAATLALIGLVLYAKFPDVTLFENAVYRWCFLFASMTGVILPLKVWEWALFWFIDSVVLPALPFLRELVDFVHCAQGHLADIAAIVMALLLYKLGFSLSFGAQGELYFTRACTALLVIKGGTILKNVALKVSIYRLYRQKHAKLVADSIFYEEVSRCLSAPLPLALAEGDPVAWAAAARGPDPDYDSIRHSLTPTQLLDLEGFWAQASYVRQATFTVYDENGDCMIVDTEGLAIEYAGAAFDRLAAAKLARDDRRAEIEASYGCESSDEDVRAHRLFAALPSVNSPQRTVAGGLRPSHLPRPALMKVKRALLPGRPPKTAVPHVEDHAAGTGVEDGEREAAIPGGSPSDEAAAVEGVGEESPPSADTPPPVAVSLTREDLAPCFADPSDLDAVLQLMDLGRDGVITRDEMTSAFTLFLAGWTSTKAGLESYSGISGALQMIFEAIYWVLSFFCTLAIFGVDFTQVLVPLGTVVISLSFAFGPSISALVTSLIFILVHVPYEVGDRVQISTVCGGAACVVTQIYVLTTEFQCLADNKRTAARNSDLAPQAITNYRRSPNACLSVKFIVTQSITGEQIAALKTGADHFLRLHQTLWLPTCSVFFSPSYGPGGLSNAVDVTFYATMHASWQEGGKVFPAYNALLVALVSLFSASGLAYTAPAKPIAIVAEMGAPGAVELQRRFSAASLSGHGKRRSDSVSSSRLVEEVEEEGGEDKPLLRTGLAEGLRLRSSAGKTGTTHAAASIEVAAPASKLHHAALPTVPESPTGGPRRLGDAKEGDASEDDS